jgi:hypothetical protein
MQWHLQSSTYPLSAPSISHDDDGPTRRPPYSTEFSFVLVPGRYPRATPLTANSCFSSIVMCVLASGVTLTTPL